MLRAIDFHGLKGVEFSKGEYTALLIPEMGANLVRLANTRLGAEILRTPGPGEIETFRSRPQVFGLPILFPPNRIADGRYVFEGRTYQYPITIERERNYHHGVLKSEAFLVSKARETDREVMIECRYYANAGNDAVYRDFPHEFKCKITYRLTAEGLEQEVVFFNRSETRMPLGVGFHTPLTIPFAGGTDADYVMHRPAGSGGAINPLTTLAQAGVAAGMTEADARANVALQLAIGAAKIDNYQDDPAWDDAQVRDTARTAAASCLL